MPWQRTYDEIIAAAESSGYTLGESRERDSVKIWSFGCLLDSK